MLDIHITLSSPLVVALGAVSLGHTHASKVYLGNLWVLFALGFGSFAWSTGDPGWGCGWYGMVMVMDENRELYAIVLSRKPMPRPSSSCRP